MGMAVTPDNSTLIVVDSYRHSLVAVRHWPDGGLSNRRVWADLGEGTPDGTCLDAQGAVWYADVPNQRCVRVAEGSVVLQVIELDRGCLACARRPRRDDPVHGGSRMAGHVRDGAAGHRSGGRHPGRRAGGGLALMPATGHQAATGPAPGCASWPSAAAGGAVHRQNDLARQVDWSGPAVCLSRATQRGS
jgi:SMP-30/Gluconolactonase/LRE-like region